MEVAIYNLEGKETGKGSVPDALFAGKVVESLLWEAVNAQRASWRQGTHDTKTRADVRGGGAKPYKQKGTGQARQGSSRAPNHVGGGVVFGPHPRNYAYKLPKTARRAALRSALSSRGTNNRVALVDGTGLAKPSTQTMVRLLDTIGQPRALVVGHGQISLQRSTRNLALAKYIDVDGLNVYDIVNHSFILLTQEAVVELEQRLVRQAAEGGQSDAA